MSDDKAELIKQQRFREGRTRKVRPSRVLADLFTPTAGEFDMTNATHPFDALMDITARPPAFSSGAKAPGSGTTRQALSRLHPGLGGQLPRPLPARRRRRAPAQARQLLTPSPAFYNAPSLRLAKALVEHELLRSGVLRQFRRGSQRRRDQARAQIRRAPPERRLRDHHLRGRLPRPHAGDHVGFGQEGLRAAVRAQGAGLSQRRC